MSSHDWMEADAVCPFFRRYRRAQAEITCEPPDEASMIVTAQRFKDIDAMRSHFQRLCCSMEDHQRCPIYKAVAEQYEDKEKQQRGV